MTSENNFEALAILLRLFKNMSDEPVMDDAEFRREVHVRWSLWRDVEGWVLNASSFRGYFELHLREAVLGIRVFKVQDNGEHACIIQMRILLNGEGLHNSALKFADDPDAKLVQALLLEQIAQHECLKPLERSVARCLGRYFTSDSLSRELTGLSQAEGRP